MNNILNNFCYKYLVKSKIKDWMNSINSYKINNLNIFSRSVDIQLSKII